MKPEKIYSKYFEPYIEKWQKRLRLEDWIINISLTNGVINNDPDIMGYTTVNTLHGKKAEVEFLENLRHISDDQREWYIIHELLHIICDEGDRFADHYLPEYHRDWHRRLVENRVSQIATILLFLSKKR